MAHILAKARTPVRKVINRLPQKYIEALEQNQLIASCCRHPENHDIEAWYSCDAQEELGLPDIYKFHCTCGRVHVRFCIGGSHPDAKNYTRAERPELFDYRPFAEAR